MQISMRFHPILVQLLNLPIALKILIANTVLIIIGAIGSIMLVQSRIESQQLPSLMVLFTALGVFVSVVINYVIIQTALSPLAVLRRTVRAVQDGDLHARVGSTIFGDPDLSAFGETLNSMLDHLEAQAGLLRTRSERLQDFSATVLAAQEEERNRIARELHDEVGQGLTALMLGLRHLQDVEEPDIRAERIAGLRKLSGGVLDEVQRLSRDLRPATLNELGLIPTVRGYLKEFRARTGIDVDLTVQPVNQDWRAPSAVETAIYRIIQEALTNVIRHARAHHVNVILVRTAHDLSVTIVDDGVGFDASAQPERPSLGLFGMHERAALVGGVCSIISRPGAGTRIQVRVPHVEDVRAN